MRKLSSFCLFALLGMLLACSGSKPGASSGTSGSAPLADGWVSLFNGKNLDGWKAVENPGSFSVENGAIVVHGPRAHLFYVGPEQGGNFRNFEFKAQVMTTPGSNSGIFIHTAVQEEGWPNKGHEIQVNNSHTDWRRTGSLYSYQDVREVIAQDNVWYTEHIIVQDKKVTVKINDQTVVEYTEPPQVWRPEGAKTKVLSSGTFALQAHDPQSKVYFKDIQVKPLP
ncbi:MAG: 3-keto-disaccharide hydrolase [Adhaeribacter sp.]